MSMLDAVGEEEVGEKGEEGRMVNFLRSNVVEKEDAVLLREV